MKFTTISVAVAAMFVFAQSAQAREHYRHHRYHVAHYARHHSSSGDAAMVCRAKHVCRQCAKRFAPKLREPKLFGSRLSGTRRLRRPNRYPYRRATVGVVRLGDAAAGVRRSGTFVQPGAQLGALATGRTGRRRRGRGVVAPRRQDRRPRWWRVDHRIRQRRQPDSAPGRARSPAPSPFAGDDRINRYRNVSMNARGPLGKPGGPYSSWTSCTATTPRRQ